MSRAPGTGVIEDAEEVRDSGAFAGGTGTSASRIPAGPHTPGTGKSSVAAQHPDETRNPLAQYRADFAVHSSALGNDTLAQFRRSAFTWFEPLGFPTTRDEDWHFTSVAPIAERTFKLHDPHARVPELAVRDLAGMTSEWSTIVFVDGRYSSQLSSAQQQHGISVRLLADAVREHAAAALRLGTLAAAERSGFTALNAAFVNDGVVVEIAPNADVAKPLHIVHVRSGGSDGYVTHPRHLVVAGPNSRATVIETYASAGGSGYFTNAVSEVFLGDGAHLSHYKLQRENTESFHVGTIQVMQDRASRYDSFSFATGAALSRTNIYSTLRGEGAECVLNGLYLADGTQHVDHQTLIEHASPNCPSRELYKGILAGRSHGVFNGKVYVHPIAQKTDGKQSNNNLLLSEQARVDTKPQLEIFADDVKCTHGATVGRLDENALFYLRSRGVGVATARKLLTYAFAADVLERIPLDELRDTLERQVLERFTA